MTPAYAPLLEARGLRKRLGGKELFGGLDLHVARAELLAIRGPSGAGKTTLLRVLAGLAQPDSGVVAFEGSALGELSSSVCAKFRARDLGFVFQQGNLVPHLSVSENVRLPAAFGARRATAAEAEAALAQVGLPAFAGRRAGELSGGEAQRVALARALVAQPKILLCDEPTGSLDVETAARIAQVLVDTCRSLECAAVIATHDRALWSACTRVLALGDVSP